MGGCGKAGTPHVMGFAWLGSTASWMIDEASCVGDDAFDIQLLKFAERKRNDN